ncbi:MAG TPA: FAD-dependent oxidoreductase [Thermodesulfobacteriota bacterium]|nr:FAD-dependent oxidoreductase [Thermodesulfobacteriota bacterium]
MKKNALIIEEYACWGCMACEVACKQENNPPDDTQGVKYLSVWGDGPKLMNGKLDFMWRVNICRQCDDPICAKACPEGAITKDPKTGIVFNDNEKCTGCNAVPGKSGPEKQETSSCKVGCPAHINVQGYVSLAAKGKFQEALQLIKEENPFPSICGRVCHHPCESDCNRSQIDEPIASHSIERFLADLDLNERTRYKPGIKTRKEDKVAIVGSGPAGLTCAYFLAQEGYQVTVFEKADQLGGMLTMGIPSYRLPHQIVEAEIQLIRDLGVTLKTGIEIGKDKTISQLREEGFKAIFIAIGTQECLRMGIEGEDLKGIHGGLDYLRKVNLGNPLTLGKDVAVIGGGNTAIDAVRSARRLGAENAFIIYRRGLEEMPSRPEEIEECQEEGIPIHILTHPVRFIGENGKVKAIECVKMVLTDPDKSGRRKPEPLPGSEFTITVDAVITALGQEADWACLTPECACTLTEWGTMTVDPLTLQSDDPDIFAGGDAVRGPQTVIEAIADGKQAAISIDRYVRGMDLRLDRDKRLKAITKPQMEKYDPAARAQMPRLNPRERIKNLNEVQKGFSKEMVVQEAARCISCGTCCVQACPYGSITFDEKIGIARKCNLCYDRVTNGLYPACADNVCLAHCIYFGDPAEIEKKILDKRRIRGGWGEIIPTALR